MPSQFHIGLAATTAAIALGLLIQWLRMKYPDSRHVTVMNGVLVAAISCALISVGITVDGLGYTGLRSQPPLVYAALILLIAFLFWLYHAGGEPEAPRPSEPAPQSDAPKVAEDNKGIRYVFHGGTHHHNSITIIEPAPPTPRFPRGSHAPDHRPTFVRFRPSDLTLLDSHNVSSVTHNGTGDFTISFADASRIGSLACVPLPPTPHKFKCVSDFQTSIRVVFEDEEPEIVALRFDDE